MEETRRSFLLEPSAEPVNSGLAFLRHARFRLRQDYLVKIKASIDLLNDGQLWWRPNEASNSIGNLLLHLSGNVRQWVIAGVGGADDTRNRQREFAERSRVGKDELIGLLVKTLDEADAVMAKVESEVRSSQSDAPLQRECTPQGFKQTVFDALFHAVEHFSYHTGQIVFMAKWLEPGKLRFYDDLQLSGKG